MPEALLLLQIAAFAAVMSAGGLVVGWHQIVVRARWWRAGRELGLTESYPLGGVPRLEGTIAEFHVTVIGDVAKRAKMTINGMPPNLKFLRAVAPSGATGAPLFDRVVWTEPSAFVSALLDEPTRDAIMELIDRGGSIEDGVLRDSMPVGLETSHRLVSRVESAVKIAKLVSRHVDIPAALAIGSAQDEGGARERCLWLLVEHFRDAPATQPACRRARRDVLPSVRLIAAIGLGAEGAQAFAELVRSEWVVDEIAMKAIAHAADKLPLELAKPTLGAALNHPRPIIRAQGIHSAARAGWSGIFPSLIAHMHADDPLCRKALASGLGRFPGEDFEAALVDMLDLDPETRLAAAISLGDVGGIASVEKLRPHASALLDSELKRAATDAIRKIQGRAIGAGAGQLTVAEPEGDGRVSLAHDAAGDLALAQSGSLALVKKSE